MEEPTRITTQATDWLLKPPQVIQSGKVHSQNFFKRDNYCKGKSTEVLVDSKKRKTCNNIIGEGGSGLNYDSDEISDDNNKMEEISARNGGNSPNANSTITGGVHQKGKKT
ncbi:hypothetical protein JHK85_020552 [Glycine max]|nr:hypothetical protein JHK85_020552 [Glycine max]